MLKNFQGDSWGLIPPMRMPSLLPHDLCHGRNSSRWLPAVIEFQLSYSRSWKMMLWKVLHSICNMQYALNMQYAGSRQCSMQFNLELNHTQVRDYGNSHMYKILRTWDGLCDLRRPRDLRRCKILPCAHKRDWVCHPILIILQSIILGFNAAVWRIY